MRLIDLQPWWRDGGDGVKYLNFYCPGRHKVWPEDPESQLLCELSIPMRDTNRAFPDNGWDMTDSEDFEKISVTPSIWHHCKENPHFFIKNGEIQMA